MQKHKSQNNGNESHEGGEQVYLELVLLVDQKVVMNMIKFLGPSNQFWAEKAQVCRSWFCERRCYAMFIRSMESYNGFREKMKAFIMMTSWGCCGGYQNVRIRLSQLYNTLCL